MLIAMMDVVNNKVLDLVGDHKILMQELVDLYNRYTTGPKVTQFASVEEARDKAIDAVARRYLAPAFQGEVTASAPAAVTPTQTVEALGPVARARAVFAELGRGRPRKEHIEACAKLGIKRSTAAAQYQAWKTKEAARRSTRGQRKQERIEAARATLRAEAPVQPTAH